jgi:hypothetical protein
MNRRSNRLLALCLILLCAGVVLQLRHWNSIDPPAPEGGHLSESRTEEIRRLEDSVQKARGELSDLMSGRSAIYRFGQRPTRSEIENTERQTAIDYSKVRNQFERDSLLLSDLKAQGTRHGTTKELPH